MAEELSLSGENITIGFIDSGINLQHEVFERFSGNIPFYNVNDPTSYGNPLKIKDFHGHGSHVASIALGNSSQFRGIAPNASCVVVSVFNESSSNSISPEKFFAAVEWIQMYALSNPLDILSLSLGMPIFPDMEDPFLALMQNLTQEGITVVASAGNSGDMGSSTVFSPGTSPYVITIGNFDLETCLISETSGQGPTNEDIIKPDVIAPGVQEWGADYQDNDGYMQLSGTSQSVPIVAGLIALLLEYCQREAIPITPQEIKWLLCMGALNLDGENFLLSMNQNNIQGWGLAQLKPMIEFLQLKKSMGSLDWMEPPLNYEFEFGGEDAKVLLLPIKIPKNLPLAVEIDFTGSKDKIQLGLFSLDAGEFGIPELLFKTLNDSEQSNFLFGTNMKLVFQVSDNNLYCLAIKCAFTMNAEHFIIRFYSINNLPWFFGATIILFLIVILAIVSLSRWVKESETK